MCILGGSSSMSSTTSVFLFPHEKVTAAVAGNGSPCHSSPTALRARNPTRVRHVRHSTQLRLQGRSL